MDTKDIIEVYIEDKQKPKRYLSPISKKRQRMSSYHGRSGKVKIYTEEEIAQYRAEQLSKEIKKLYF